MQPYTKMAAYYDIIYHVLVDYEAECNILEEIFHKHSKRKVQSILDVGCGTGNHSYILAKRGYEVVGIDLSEQMLQIAREKATGGLRNPEFHNMNMRRIVLGRKFDAALILFGSFTYLLKDSDVKSCLSSIRKHIVGRGLIVFEFWHNSGMYPAAETISGHRPWDKTEDKKASRLVIRLGTSRYDTLTNLMTILFDHYVIDTKRRKVLTQFQETHVMRTYDISEVKRLLTENGFKPVAFYAKQAESRELNPPTLSTGRVYCVARRSE